MEPVKRTSWMGPQEVLIPNLPNDVVLLALSYLKAQDLRPYVKLNLMWYWTVVEITAKETSEVYKNYLIETVNKINCFTTCSLPTIVKLVDHIIEKFPLKYAQTIGQLNVLRAELDDRLMDWIMHIPADTLHAEFRVGLSKPPLILARKLAGMYKILDKAAGVTTDKERRLLARNLVDRGFFVLGINLGRSNLIQAPDRFRRALFNQLVASDSKKIAETVDYAFEILLDVQSEEFLRRGAQLLRKQLRDNGLDGLLESFRVDLRELVQIHQQQQWKADRYRYLLQFFN